MRLATPLVEAAHEDPVVLRALSGLFVAIGAGERATQITERWAALSGNPAEAYRFAMERFAQAGDAPNTAMFARRLVEWTGGAHGSTMRAVSRALRLIGRLGEAKAVEDASCGRSLGPSSEPPPRSVASPSMGAPASLRSSQPREQPNVSKRKLSRPSSSSWGPKSESTLIRLALVATVALPRQSLDVTFLAAALADRAGQARLARRILADAWQRDPERFGAASYNRLAAASRGRRLFSSLPWDRIRRERIGQ
jgi:hypothetical protein